MNEIFCNLPNCHVEDHVRPPEPTPARKPRKPWSAVQAEEQIVARRVPRKDKPRSPRSLHSPEALENIRRDRLWKMEQVNKYETEMKKQRKAIAAFRAQQMNYEGRRYSYSEVGYDLPFVTFVSDLHAKHRRVAVTEFTNG